MRKIFLLGLLFVLGNDLKAQDTDTIVTWHTIKVTSNYLQELENNKTNDFLVVWVGIENLEAFATLKFGKNVYIDSLPNVEQCILIAKGKYLHEKVSQNDLNSPQIVKKLADNYCKCQNRSIEEDILGVGLPEPPKYSVNNRQAFRAPIGHTHTCPKCGNVWDHVKNRGHYCDKQGCGGQQWWQDPSPRMVPLF